MATDFTNNNTTIGTSGGVKPNTKNTPLDIRTRVNSKADIESIPNPFVGMKILVLQDETNDNQMTEYVVISLKANNLGIADSKVNEVVLVKDFLGVSGNGMTDEQVQQLNTAYTHSQSTHVQQSQIPTKTSQLQNDSRYATETYVTNKIAEAQLGGGGEVDLSGYYTKTETDNIIQDYTGGKKQVYLTQAEYDLLTDSEKNDSSKVYNITDATEQVIPADLTINSNNLLQLIDENGDTIGSGVTLSISSETTSYTLPIATSNTLGGVKIGNGLSINAEGVLSLESSDVTDEEITEVLTNVFGESYITVACTGISLDGETVEVQVNKTITLNATITPSDCTDEIIWSAENENCTVVDGVVTGVTEGSCVITATCGDYSDTCTVNVSGDINSDLEGYEKIIFDGSEDWTVLNWNTYNNTEYGIYDLIVDNIIGSTMEFPATNAELPTFKCDMIEPKSQSTMYYSPQEGICGTVYLNNKLVAVSSTAFPKNDAEAFKSYLNTNNLIVYFKLI